MISAILFLTLKHGKLANEWYTSAPVTFQVQYPGNPYDLEENDVRVRFMGDKGVQIERLAYYDRGTYRAELTAPQAGKFKPVLVRNGVVQDVPCEDPEIEVKRVDHGFIRTDSQNSNRFRYDDGTPFYPIGFGLYGQGTAENISKMGAVGINWTRIGATEGKNPWWPSTAGGDPLPGEMSDTALLSWQKLTDACDSAGVNFQMVLFDRKAIGTDWAKNPWNSANGGFLANPSDFFTDQEAKRREKVWIREAVARFGASPHLFAWELLNDVDGTPETSDWLKEMVAYIRSIDPYKHPITAGSNQEVHANLDFQTLIGTTGEGLALNVNPSPTDGFAGTIAQQLISRGSGVTLNWDVADIDKRSLYDQFKGIAKVLEVSELPRRPNARVLNLSVSGSVTATGIGESDWMILRTVGSTGNATIAQIPLSDGDYTLTEIDPRNGDTMDRTVHVSNFTLRSFPITGPSDYFVFRRKG